ncbi:MAG: hypothetical protein HQL51_02770 [Magnetococcales bacterium]|nr:hypothetical protein [Magnetococcales bacterium]
MCEDENHYRFAKAFLSEKGLEPHQIVKRMAPPSQGSAEQWVRDNYPLALSSIRGRSRRIALIVVLDADKGSVEQHYRELAVCLKKNGKVPLKNDEAVAIIAPKWCLENWYHFFLTGESNEEQAILGGKKFKDKYSKELPVHARDMARSFIESFRFPENEPAMPSLRAARSEWLRLRELMNA